MTTFSKLQIVQLSSLGSLRSRLFSKHDLSIEKNKSPYDSQRFEIKQPYPLSSETGSSAQLYRNGYVELDEFGKSQMTTEIKGVASKVKQEHGGIQKLVQVEQSSDIVSDDPHTS